MPINLLVRAVDSETVGIPGAWRKGDIVNIRTHPQIWGNKENLPNFIRIHISNSATGDLGWLQANDDLVNRREVIVNPTEVDAVVATWQGRVATSTEQHVAYTRQQFNSRIVTR